MLAEPTLKESELRYRRLFESAQDGILILDARTGMIEDVNPYLVKMLGYSREEFLKKKLWEVGAFRDIEASKDAFEALQENEYIRYENLPLKTKDGQMIEVEFVSNVYQAGSHKVIQCNIRDITDHKRIVAALQENEKKYFNLLNQSSDGVFIIDLLGNILTVNKAMCTELGFSEEEFLSMNIWEIIPAEYLDQYKERLIKILAGESFELAGEYEICGKDGRNHYVEVLSTPHYNGRRIVGFQGIARDVTARKQGEAELRESEERYRLLVDSLPDGVLIHSGGQILFANQASATIIGAASPADLTGRSVMQLVHPAFHEMAAQRIQQSLSKGIPLPLAVEKFVRQDGTLIDVEVLGIPLSYAGKPAMLAVFNDISGRKQAEERMQRQLDHLTAFREIDMAIAGSMNLRSVLETVLEHVITDLGVDAALILLYDPHAQVLKYELGKGFRSTALQFTVLRLGEGYAGQAVLGENTIHIPNLQTRTTDFLRSPIFYQEEFVSYFGIPLFAQGEVKGVLEIFHRSALNPDEEKLNFMETMAKHVAIAIDNATLYKDIQRSNVELSMAYDATIEGWSRALDLRDRETEGHSQRVTKITVNLARILGLGEAELAQVRWGALLHDIGKMGVPDNILLKPGALTEEEWVAMKKHPRFAYDLLSPIRYLRLALDIPYCHHEKWDGTGYPRGLKGEQIPLPARIFAVVDVWDALRSDRPYRAAWPEDKVRKHITALSGTHFDPQVADVFMKMTNKIDKQ